MLKKILLFVAVVLVAFLGYVSTRPGSFSYERSGIVHASPDKVFPYLSDFHLGSHWSPFEQKDPNLARTYTGPASGVGSGVHFVGNSEVGEGQLEILKVVPNELVELKLEMIKPFHGVNLIQYRLTPDAQGSRFSWKMSGESGFPGKLMSVFIDCEKMIGGEFEKGIGNLDKLMVAQSAAPAK